MQDIVEGSMKKVFSMVNDDAHKADIERASFDSALDGIRSGVMTYSGDKILPMIQAEIAERLT